MAPIETSPGGKGPVGTGERVVGEGDCLLSIAFEAGHFHEKVWLHSNNAAVRTARKVPHKLLPGDRIHVPPLEIERVDAATDKRHSFRRKGIPAKLRLRVQSEESPELEAQGAKNANPNDMHAKSEDPDPPPPPEVKARANVPYHLVLDGETTEGTTNGEGEVEVPILPHVRSGELILEPGTERETHIPLKLGSLDPSDEPSGIAQRLANLGFAVDPGEPNSDAVEDAIAAFQEANGLDATGKADATTREKLEELHGS